MNIKPRGERMNDKIADAFYDENFKELEKLTGIKASSQYEFENKFNEVTE